MSYQTKGGALRVQKNKNKSGEITSLSISIVRNMRINSNPSHKRLGMIGTWRISEVTANAAQIYRILDERVAELTKDGSLWKNDSSAIYEKMATVISRPKHAPMLRKLPKHVVKYW